MPTATVVVALVDFLISFSILVLMMAWYQFLPGWQILVLPVFVLLAIFASVGPALWITALNVKYRDFRYVIPFLVESGDLQHRSHAAQNADAVDAGRTNFRQLRGY